MSLATPRKGYKSVKWYFGKEIEIPEEWEMIKLGHLFDIGSSKRVLESQWKTEGVPFYRGREITAMSNYGKVKNKLFISEDLYEEYSSKYGVPKAGDILITAIGTIGNPYIVKEHEKFYFKDASVLWLNKTSNVESKFIDFWFKSERFFQQLDKGNGSTVDSLTIKKLQSIRSLLPTSLEQQKIVIILSNVDNLIESTGKVITHSKKVKTGLMQKLLTRGIGHTKFKKIPWLFSKEIEIPEEWDLSNFKEITINHKQGFYTEESYSDNGIKLIRISDLHNPKLSYETMPKLTLDEKIIKQFLVSVGDFLFARTGAGVGTFGIITEDIPCVFASYLIRFSFNQELVNNEFLGYVYQSTIVLKQQNMIRQGSSNTNINAENIKSLKLLIPPLPEQQKIASILSNIDSKITSQEQYKEKLEKLKKSLMQKLLTGEVRV